MATHSNSPLPMNDAPWWAKFVYYVGLPSAVALFLVWFVTFSLDGDIKSLHVRATELEKNQEQMLEAIRLHTVDNSYYMKEITSMKIILQQICINSATTQQERNRCIQP